MGCFGSKFRAIGILHTAYMTCKFNHSALHTQTNTKEGYLVFAGILNGLNLALDTAIAKATGYQNTVHTGHNLIHIGACVFNLLCIHPFNFQLGLIGNGRVTQGLGDADVSILQSHIFTDYGNGDLTVVLL